MTISQLRPFVRRLAQRAEQRAFNWMTAKDPDEETYREAIATFAGVYAQSAGLLAADWYNSLESESNFTAHLDDDLAEDKLDNVARWVFSGPQTPANRGRVAAHKLVFDAARRTIFANADEEGVAVARHEQAGCCDKCIVRATLEARGRNSSSDDLDQDFHPSCEGLLVPVRTGVYEPPPHTAQWREMIARARDAGNTDPEALALWIKGH